MLLLLKIEVHAYDACVKDAIFVFKLKIDGVALDLVPSLRLRRRQARRPRGERPAGVPVPRVRQALQRPGQGGQGHARGVQGRRARPGVPRERVAMVNDLCSWLKRCLWRFTGMEMRNLQSYLNWYVYLFRAKQAGERWPEIARVVRHLLMTETRFRSST